MVTHHVYPKRRIAVIRVTGKIANSECRRAFDAVRRDPDFSADTNWVIVAMDREVIDPDLAVEFVRELHALQLPTEQSRKCAVVVRGARKPGALAPFLSAGLRRSIAVRSFVSESTALDWASQSSRSAAGQSA